MTELIQFSGPIEALSFSEEVLSRSARIETFFSKLLHVPGRGEWSFDDLKDQALAVSSIVRRIEPRVYGHLLLSIYGREDANNDRPVCEWLVEKAKSAVEQMADKEEYTILKVAYYILRGHRALVLHNRPTSLASVARAVGVRRSELNNSGWREAQSVMRRAIADGLELGESQLGSLLSDRGFVSGP